MSSLQAVQSLFVRSSKVKPFYAVVFCVDGDWKHASGTFQRISSARKLKKALSKKWESKIFMGGPGGIEVN